MGAVATSGAPGCGEDAGGLILASRIAIFGCKGQFVGTIYSRRMYELQVQERRAGIGLRDFKTYPERRTQR